jgi:hypothetical protein
MDQPVSTTYDSLTPGIPAYTARLLDPKTETHLLQSFAAKPIPNPPHMITFLPIIPKTGLARSNEAGEEAPHMMVREAFSAPFTPAFFSSNQILAQIGSDRIV